MTLPVIRKATWERIHYPRARYIVIEKRYGTYTAHETLGKALRQRLRHLLKGYK